MTYTDIVTVDRQDFYLEYEVETSDDGEDYNYITSITTKDNITDLIPAYLFDKICDALDDSQHERMLEAELHRRLSDTTL